MTIGSPCWVKFTWQNRLRCWPAGLVLSTLILNTTSLVSLVISMSGAVTFVGSPTSLTTALPSNGVVTCILQSSSASLPCSLAVRSMLATTSGGATSMVANCDDTHTGPLPTVALPSTAVFHLRGWALGAAFIGNTVSFWFSAMVTAEAEPTPGGLNSA